MSQHTLSIVHIADLRAVGGVERMLFEFIKNTPDITHYLVLQDKTIHPTFEKITQYTKTIRSAKHLGHLVPLPKKFRSSHRIALVNQTQANTVLIWNQVVDLTGVKIPCVYYEHGSAWYSHNPELIKACFGQVKKVIAVSLAAKRMLQLHQKVTNDITVIHNTLLPNTQLPKNISPKKIQHNTITIGVACRLVPIKSVPLIILAVNELKKQGVDIKAKIAGTGAEFDVIKNLIEHLNLTNEVELMGFVSDMNEFYRQIDCYVCTSTRESFGLSGLDAMMHGLPVIIPNIDGLPEVVTHEYNGFCIEPNGSTDMYFAKTHASIDFCNFGYYPQIDDIAPPKLLDPKQIAHYIKKLTSAPDLYHQMSINALQSTQQIESFDNLCKKVLSVLKNVSS